MSDRMVLVKWIDSGGDGRWLNRNDILEHGGLASCESVGWLIHEDDEKIILGLSLNRSTQNDDVQGYMAIPKVAVSSVIDLRKK